VNAPAKARTQPRRAVRREQLSDEVAARLRTGIMAGTLRPGTFIRLDETAAELGVSITPVREALRTLRSEGMVQLEPHRGHVVVPLSRGDVEDIFWLQATIAKELAATAAERITEAQIDDLDRLNEALAAAVEHHEPDEIASAEFAFHRAFNRSTGRIKLAWFLLHVARYLPGEIYAGDPQWGVSAVATHRELIAALRRRDRDMVDRDTVDRDTVVRLTGGEFADGAQRLIARLDETGLWG
jgi:DNA-binding GntR family transcriptional regulator